MGNKSAEAPPLPGVYSDAGLLFSGWSREGYWSEGRLLRGKEGRTVNLDKFLGRTPQEAPRAPQVNWRYVHPAETAKSLLQRLGVEIPVFMESHL